MNHEFHSEARREVISVTRHYQDINKRLGKKFRNEIEETIRILVNPEGELFKEELLKMFFKKISVWNSFIKWMKRKVFV